MHLPALACDSDTEYSVRDSDGQTKISEQVRKDKAIILIAIFACGLWGFRCSNESLPPQKLGIFWSFHARYPSWEAAMRFIAA